MKPPVTIDILMDMWSKDAQVDLTEPARELAKISSLHAKYLNILSHHNLIIKKLNSDYTKKKSIMFQYYSGDLNDPEELEKYGFNEPMRKKILRQDIPIYLDGDEQLINILLKKSLHQEIVDYCSSVIKEINNRTFQLNNIIKWEIFTSGAS
jgi:uncharacterized protein YihD (DUF1040 family)